MEILKTYKLYIGGQFPRTESGRSYLVSSLAGEPLANACLASRKDIRNAVQVARKAHGAWAAKTALNRSQIIYRIAEMLEARKGQFIDELSEAGFGMEEANAEILSCIDRCVYYAGWADKFQALISSVNPVASSHFNFSTPEPMGVVGVLACQNTPLIGFISQILPIIIGGNTVVVLANSKMPLSAISFCEVLATSDVPGGVVNVLTGSIDELLPTLASHMDVNALSLATVSNMPKVFEAQELAIENLKRTQLLVHDFKNQDAQGMEFITDFQEIKTTWHPIEQIAGGAGAY